MAAPSPAASWIVLDRISKRFGTLWANREIALEFREGEIHAIVGENGAGKSTLMKILYGHFQPDAGDILLQGKVVRFTHPRDAIRAGIGMVHQQPLIFPRLSGFENITVGFEHARWGSTPRKQSEQALLELGGRFGFELPLDLPASELSFAHRQQIELLRALYRGAKVLILDEPTSLLAPSEADRLLQFIRALQARGHTILFVSHRLHEVFAIADRISVLRSGAAVATLEAAQTAMETIARLILPEGKHAPADSFRTAGGEAAHPPPPSEPSQAPLLEIREITVRPSGHDVRLEGFSLAVRKGEILGMGGIVGNGQRTLARALCGMVPIEKGAVLFDGTDLSGHSIAERLEAGLRWLPANPLEEALLPDRSLWENLLLGSRHETRFRILGWLRKRRIKRWARAELEANEVKCAGVSDRAAGLSGGNQQKLALARVLSDSPRLILLEQPGRGLDLHAQQRLYRQIRNLNAHGATFVTISHDLEELFALAQRIGIFFRGRLMGIVPAEEAFRETLGRWMLGLPAPPPPQEPARSTPGLPAAPGRSEP